MHSSRGEWTGAMEPAVRPAWSCGRGGGVRIDICCLHPRLVCCSVRCGPRRSDGQGDRRFRRIAARRRSRGTARADDDGNGQGDQERTGVALENQNADGSYGTGTTAGNIAVTSLGRAGVHGVGVEPRAWPISDRRSTRRSLYVMDNTSPSGFIAVAASSTHGPMYSHGFGTLFLAEAYGMTHRPEIREKLQKAVRLIIDSQKSKGDGGISRAAGCGSVGDDLSDQCAAGGAERGAVRAQGDGRGVHPVCEAVAEP